MVQLFLQQLSSVALVLTQLRQLEDPISTFAKVVWRLLLGIPCIVSDGNPFKVEMGWKGVAWGD